MARPNYDELTKHMLSMGYVTTMEASSIVGRSPSGSTNRIMQNAGVKTIRAGRIIYWKKDDLHKVPKIIVREKPVVATVTSGTTETSDNLTSLSRRMRDMEIRVAVIESYINDILAAKHETSSSSHQENTFTLVHPKANTDEYE